MIRCHKAGAQEAMLFEKCRLPIYVITNNNIQYVDKAMDINGLHPAGIICGDMVRAYKPHKELFEKALEVTGFKADEVIHIGDSFTSDVKGAATVGIRAILLDRTNTRQAEGVTIIHSLTEVLSMI